MSAWPPHVFRRRCPRFFDIESSKQYHYHDDAGSLTGSASMAVGPGAPNAADHNAVDDGRATSTKDCESYPPMRNETRCATCNQFAPSLLSRPFFLSFFLRYRGSSCRYQPLQSGARGVLRSAQCAILQAAREGLWVVTRGAARALGALGGACRKRNILYVF